MTRYILAAPLLGMNLKEPEIRKLPIRVHEVMGGREFVFKNDRETILLRSRMAVVTLAMFMALLVFLATRQMFGAGAGVIALGLLAFDPTLLAHSSLATTDTGQALFPLLGDLRVLWIREATDPVATGRGQPRGRRRGGRQDRRRHPVSDVRGARRR